MKSTVEHLQETKIKVEAQVPYADLKPHMDKVYKELAEQVKVPGFRPGKVPARIIDQRVGRGYVVQEAINAGMPELYGQLVTEHEFTPLAAPEIEIAELPEFTNGEGELSFTVTVEVHPTFDLPKLSDIVVEVDKLDITDADVDTALNDLRGRFSTLKTVDRAIAEKDFITLDMRAVIDGKEVDQVSSVSYEVGSGNMLKGMDEALIGMKAGEEKTYKSQLAGGEYGGQEADVTLKPSAVKETELPEVDDEFAQMVSEFDTVDELLNNLRETVENEKKAEQASQARDKLFDAIAEQANFPLPEGAIEKAVADAKEKGADEERLESVRKNSEEMLRRDILLEKIASEKKVNVSQQELMEFIIHSAQTYGIDPSEFLQMVESQQRIPMLIQEIAHNKSLVKCLGEVTVKDETGAIVDLSEFLQSSEDESEEETE